MDRATPAIPVTPPSREAEIAARLFPIQDGPSIPWAVIAPHEQQAQTNHQQSLERLAQRGGLDAVEAIAVLSDQPYGVYKYTTVEQANIDMLLMITANLIAQLQQARQERDTFRQEADAIRHNYLRETKELAATADTAEAALQQAREENERLKQDNFDANESHCACCQQAREELAEAHAFLTGRGEMGWCMTHPNGATTELGKAAERQATELQQAREALDRYGSHEENCEVGQRKPCSCGLDVALKAVR